MSLPDGTTWRCADCATPYNDNATKNLDRRAVGPICDYCLGVRNGKYPPRERAGAVTRPACTCVPKIEDVDGALHYRECPLYEMDGPGVTVPDSPAGAELVPSDDDIAGVRYGELRRLDALIEDLKASVAAARSDLGAIAELLQIQASGVTAHELVTEHIIPRVKVLLVTQSRVNEAAVEVVSRLSTRGPEIDMGNGVKMRKVGERLPPEIAKGVLRDKPGGSRPPKP